MKAATQSAGPQAPSPASAAPSQVRLSQRIAAHAACSVSAPMAPLEMLGIVRPIMLHSIHCRELAWLRSMTRLPMR